MIQNTVVDKAAEGMLEGVIHSGDIMTITVIDGEISFAPARAS